MILPLNQNEQGLALLSQAFQGIESYDLSIPAAIEGQFGTVCVDDADHPSVFRLEMPPFWYFSGDATSPAAEEMMRELPPGFFVMPTFPEWTALAQRLFGERLMEWYRFSYSADSLSPTHLNGLLSASKYRDAVKPIDLRFAQEAWDDPNHFLYISLYKSPQDFLARGVGFACKVDGKVVGVANSACGCSRGIEVSIFVQERFRQRGIATALGARLALECLQRDWEPHWDAANGESCKLAEKLGYTRTGMYIAHYLQPS
jgi:GNAT superfamily N-acetyltransferase